MGRREDNADARPHFSCEKRRGCPAGIRRIGDREHREVETNALDQRRSFVQLKSEATHRTRRDAWRLHENASRSKEPDFATLPTQVEDPLGVLHHWLWIRRGRRNVDRRRLARIENLAHIDCAAWLTREREKLSHRKGNSDKNQCRSFDGRSRGEFKL